MSCPKCYSGAIHEGKPTGTVTKLHGLDTYVAEPASGQAPKGIVVIIPDAFGWDFVNIRLMADSMARKRDYRVYAPDFMRGNSAPASAIGLLHAVSEPGKTFMDKLKKPFLFVKVMITMLKFLIPNRFGRSFPIVQKWFSDLRAAEAAELPVGAAGYCWGGKHVALLAKNEVKAAGGKPLADALYTAHPSMLSFYDDINAIKLPVSFAVAEHDGQTPMDKVPEVKRIIEAKPAEQKGELEVYHGCGHGFACRIDTKTEDCLGVADRAENQALEWFEKHFEGIKY